MAEIDNQKAAEYREQAIRYYEGEDVEVDLQRSAYYFSKAAEMGDAHSMYCMGLNYIDGTGVPRDVEKGINWLRKAAENGHDYAMFELASHYNLGDIVEKDDQESLAYYEMAAQHENVYAMINAAKLYENGLGTEKDTDRAKVYFQEAYKKLEEWAIEENDDMAQEWMGELYYAGCPLIGVKIDSPQAIVWFEKAAKADNISALINLGLCYRYGMGTIVDMGKAIELNERAAAKNVTMAMCNLASIYSMGEGVERDDKKATELWAEAAHLGDPIGQSCLGEAYMLGHGVGQNYVQAVNWSRKAHKGGADGATDNLARLYLKGLGVEKDEKEAFKLFSEAAAKGNLHSRVGMAECYIEGWGVTQNLEKACEILESICNEEEELRENSVTYVCTDSGVHNPFNYQNTETYAKAYYLLGTLYYAGKGTGGANPTKAIAMLRMADRLGYEGDGMSPEELINKIVGEAEKEDIQDATDCYVEVREHKGKGERYDVMIHHADGTETPVKFVGRNKFIYLLALLIAHEGKSVAPLSTAHFSYMRDSLAEMAETLRVNTTSYSEWIDEFVYAETDEAKDLRNSPGHEGERYCTPSSYRYSNAYSGANRAVKSACNRDEYELFMLRSSGGRYAVTGVPLDVSQIELPGSLMDYLDELPTQKEISGIKVSGTKWLSIKRKEKVE